MDYIVGRCSKCTCADCVDFHKYKDAGPVSSEEFQMFEEFLRKISGVEIYRPYEFEQWRPKQRDCDIIKPRVRRPYRRFIDLVYDQETYDGGEMGHRESKEWFFATYDRESKNITLHENVRKEMKYHSLLFP